MARQITLAQAERILEACKAEAQSIGQPMNIAVVDDGGNLVAFAAMDDRSEERRVGKECRSRWSPYH